MRRDDLIEMSRVDIKKANKDDLIDIKTIVIDSKRPIAERMEAYVNEIHNPYVFLCEGRPVKIVFSSDGKSLEDVIKRHFLLLKQS